MPKKKEKDNWAKRLKKKVQKIFHPDEETERTKGVKSELEKAGVTFKTDAQKAREKREREKKKK